LEITRQIPPVADLQNRIDDITAIAQAQSIAKDGSILDLEKAIALVQGIKGDSSLYSRAQGMLANWQVEIQDVAILQRAKSFAASGTVADLQDAMNEVGKIPPNNPRGQESAKLLVQWRQDIEVIQDRPYLEAAQRLALTGDIAGLEGAIAQLRAIGQGRALYPQAQQKTREWTEQIQTIQDQPILDTAIAQAQSGNLAQAIATASRIVSGRALYGKAQSQIRDWRGELEADQILVSAQRLATQGTPEALNGAIDAVGRIPRSSRLYGQSRIALDNWSSQLLQNAQSVSSTNIPRAIAIAQAIPRSSNVYKNAQQLINQWESQLNYRYNDNVEYVTPPGN
jgi:hypothetical protein